MYNCLFLKYMEFQLQLNSSYSTSVCFLDYIYNHSMYRKTPLSTSLLSVKFDLVQFIICNSGEGRYRLTSANTISIKTNSI